MRYTKKPVTIEAIRFMGLLPETGAPIFDLSCCEGLQPPEWLMDAVAGPEEQPGSIWNVPKGHHNSAGRIYMGGLHGWVMVKAGEWIARRDEDGALVHYSEENFARAFIPLADPALTQAAKGGERSLLLDMQSECIQLRVALAAARDMFSIYAREHERKCVLAGSADPKAKAAWESLEKAKRNHTMAAMCHKAIDCRPATGSEYCPKLEAIHERGIEALAQSAFVIGEGFKTVGDSDGDDGA